MNAPARRPAPVLSLPALVRGLPPPPPASLDPFLDAASACFARYGIRRTSVQDVAARLGVNRTTVYRQVGTVDAMLRLLAARDLHRLLGALPRPGHGDDLGPATVVDLLVVAVDHARRHPVVAKVLADEPAIVGAGVEFVPELLARIATAIVPLLEAGMAAGSLARRDAVVVAEWVARIGITAVVAPPPGDLHPFLAELLVPALSPPGGRS